MSLKNKQPALGPLVDSKYFKTLNYIFLNKCEIIQPKVELTKLPSTPKVGMKERESLGVSLLTIDRVLHTDFPRTIDLEPFFQFKPDKKSSRKKECLGSPIPWAAASSQNRSIGPVLEYQGKTKIRKLFTHWVYSSHRSKALRKINNMLGAGIDVYNYILRVNRNTHRLDLSKAELSNMVSQVLYRVQLLKNDKDKACFNLENMGHVLGALVHFNLKLYFISTDELKECGLINSSKLSVSLSAGGNHVHYEQSPYLPKLLRTPVLIHKFYKNQQAYNTRLKGPLQKRGALFGESHKLENVPAQVVVYSRQSTPPIFVVRRLQANFGALPNTLRAPFKQLLGVLLLPPKVLVIGLTIAKRVKI
jgi:hypothetical protein